MKTSKIALVIALALAVAIAGCTSAEKTAKSEEKTAPIAPPELPTLPSTPTPPALPTPEVGEQKTIAQAKEFTVEASEFKFSLNAIAVSKGDKVKVTFKNTGAAPHNFVIDELGVTTKVLGNGETEVVEFTADKTGTFAFYCSVDSHRQKGMEGKATVS